MSKGQSAKNHPAILIILGFMIALPIAGSIWFIQAFRAMNMTTTNPARYSEALANLEPSQRAMFPNQIPAQVTHVDFYYFSGLGQGHTLAHLHFDAGDSFDAIHRGVRTAAAATQPSTKPTADIDIVVLDHPPTTLPADFEIWYYYQTPEVEPFRVVVAGSPSRREIIYLAD